jgi:hypothetical protein
MGVAQSIETVRCVYDEQAASDGAVSRLAARRLAMAQGSMVSVPTMPSSK